MEAETQLTKWCLDYNSAAASHAIPWHALFFLSLPFACEMRELHGLCLCLCPECNQQNGRMQFGIVHILFISHNHQATTSQAT